MAWGDWSRCIAQRILDALRAALKADKLAAILFPKNAVSNAPLVLAQLDALFPTAQGRFLFSPIALIGWGKPYYDGGTSAVVLELPEPIRIILIARLAVRLPTPSRRWSASTWTHWACWI